jgi:hypothetical protein
MAQPENLECLPIVGVEPARGTKEVLYYLAFNYLASITWGVYVENEFSWHLSSLGSLPSVH